jgi:hypothetical protein
MKKILILKQYFGRDFENNSLGSKGGNIHQSPVKEKLQELIQDIYKIRPDDASGNTLNQIIEAHKNSRDQILDGISFLVAIAGAITRRAASKTPQKYYMEFLNYSNTDDESFLFIEGLSLFTEIEIEIPEDPLFPGPFVTIL